MSQFDVEFARIIRVCLAPQAYKNWLPALAQNAFLTEYPDKMQPHCGANLVILALQEPLHNERKAILSKLVTLFARDDNVRHICNAAIDTGIASAFNTCIDAIPVAYRNWLHLDKKAFLHRARQHEGNPVTQLIEAWPDMAYTLL